METVHCLLIILLLFNHGFARATFTCGSSENTTTIDDDKVCNGYNDCLDRFASDECNCNNTVKHVCINEKCILESNICNGIDDCQDGFASDESICTNSSETMSLFEHGRTEKLDCNHKNAISCADGQTCIHNYQFCDGVYDCPDHSDERFSGPGMKCSLKSPIPRACILPQYHVFDDRAQCVNKEDLCFDLNGNLTSACFQCLDGKHIISKFQVCDGILDCADFSDECFCDEMKTPEVCSTAFIPSTNVSCVKTIHDDSYTGPTTKWRNGTVSCGDGVCVCTSMLCNGVEDCPNGVDEKYCIAPTIQRVMRCLTTKILPIENRVSGIFDPKKFLNNTVRCYNQIYGWVMARVCDGVSLCSDLQDECHVGCADTPDYCKVNISCLSGHLVCDGHWDSDRLCPNGRIDEEEMGCPQRFYCSRGKRISIREDQVCDGIMDCADGSDESKDQSCEDNRFYCENWNSSWISSANPVFVPHTLLYDGKMDCADGSDECPTSLNEDMFSWRNEMISKLSLKSMLWIIAPFALFGNIYVFITSIHASKAIKKKLNAIARTHRFMVANLAVADGLMGIYLVILAIASTVYSGSFCLASKSWRISYLCQVMGTLVIISSQASVFILLLMGLFRFYTILRPFESQITRKSFMYCYKGLFLSWACAIIIGILPWVLDYFTTDYYYNSLFFKTDQVRKSNYQDFISKLDAYQRAYSLNTNSYFVYNHTLNSNTSHVDKIFASKLMPDTKYVGKFGFYSQNSICLPSYITRSDKPGWQYSLAIITLNFSLFILMAVIYILIIYFSNPGRHPALKTSTFRCGSKNSLNFYKCKLQARVARLLLTDFLCWIPLCILSYIYFSGIDFDKSVIAVCGIILLPINSALNPVLYSGIFDSLFKKLKLNFNKSVNLKSFTFTGRKTLKTSDN